MEHQPAAIFTSPPDPPPFPPSSSTTVDLSPLEFILALIALITVPALIYTFLFSINCPAFLFRSRSRSRHSSTTSTATEEDSQTNKVDENLSEVKYKKETHVREIGSECPVCLSVFVDGEEVKQLSVCKHSFHATCINTWLRTHDNCPICRASVNSVKRNSTSSNGGGGNSNNRNDALRSNRERDRGDRDLQQGLPDASNLV